MAFDIRHAPLFSFRMHPVPLPWPTCAGENEANVRWLLDSHPEMALVPQAPRLGQPGLTGGSVRGPSSNVQWPWAFHFKLQPLPHALLCVPFCLRPPQAA